MGASSRNLSMRSPSQSIPKFYMFSWVLKKPYAKKKHQLDLSSRSTFPWKPHPLMRLLGAAVTWETLVESELTFVDNPFKKGEWLPHLAGDVFWNESQSIHTGYTGCFSQHAGGWKLKVGRVLNWDGYPIGYLNGTKLNLNCVGFALNVQVPNPKANWAQARSATAAAELQSSTLVTCHKELDADHQNSNGCGSKPAVHW